MNSDLIDRGALAVIAAELQGPFGGLERARSLAAVWGGPVSLIVLRASTGGPSPTDLPENIDIVEASGELADILRGDRSAPMTEPAASALLEAAAARSPVARLWFVAPPGLVDVAATLSGVAFPAPFDLELLDADSAPDDDWLWEVADSIVVREDTHVYRLAAGRPAVPVRVAPCGVDDESIAALRALPQFGGGPRISIVVPGRGRGASIARTAECVFDRTPELFELIVIHDSAHPTPPAAVERLAVRDSRVRLLVHEGERGLAASCNEGLAAARGDVVVLLSHDVTVTPGWSTRFVRHLASQDRAGAVGPVWNRGAGLQQVAPVDYNERTLSGLTAFAERIARSASGRATGVVRLAHFCLAISRPALRRVGGFDPRFFPEGYEDDDYCLRLMTGGLVPYRADDVFVHFEAPTEPPADPVALSRLAEDNWRRFKSKWRLPADRPRERHYSPEELLLDPYDRQRCFIAPWKATAPIKNM